MFIVITGLDGSGTSTVAKRLHELDTSSLLVHTPSIEYSNRDIIDQNVRNISPLAHYFYYLSSVVYISDYIKNTFDYKKNNVYCVRYLIDTIVSHKAAGLNVELDYEHLAILKPDKTIFVKLDESIRQQRITQRGKSILDKVLDDEKKRNKFLELFDSLLSIEDTIYFDNSKSDLSKSILNLYEIIRKGSR